MDEGVHAFDGIDLIGKCGGADRSPFICIDDDPGTDGAADGPAGRILDFEIPQGENGLYAGWPGSDPNRIPPGGKGFHSQHHAGEDPCVIFFQELMHGDAQPEGVVAGRILEQVEDGWNGKPAAGINFIRTDNVILFQYIQF